jgi:hypothetical protein
MEPKTRTGTKRICQFTVSSNEDVMAASISLCPLMLARTGDPKPIDESCLLKQITKHLLVSNMEAF